MTDVLNVPKDSVISSKNNGWHVDEYVSMWHISYDMVTRACGKYIDKCLGDSDYHSHVYLYKFREGDQMIWLCR